MNNKEESVSNFTRAGIKLKSVILNNKHDDLPKDNLNEFHRNDVKKKTVIFNLNNENNINYDNCFTFKFTTGFRSVKQFKNGYDKEQIKKYCCFGN